MQKAVASRTTFEQKFESLMLLYLILCRFVSTVIYCCAYFDAESLTGLRCLICVCSCSAECFPTVRAWHIFGAAEARQRTTAAGVGNDGHRHQTLQQRLWQRWRGH